MVRTVRTTDMIGEPAPIAATTPITAVVAVMLQRHTIIIAPPDIHHESTFSTGRTKAAC